MLEARSAGALGARCPVFTPTLTGVGERSHLLSPQDNLDPHIADVVNLIQWERPPAQTANISFSRCRSRRGDTVPGRRGLACVRGCWLVLEVSLTVVLLVGAGLLLKSYQRLRTTDLGVPVDGVLTMHFSLPEVRYPQPRQQVEFLEHVIERIRSLPGVQAAGLVGTAPGQGGLIPCKL